MQLLNRDQLFQLCLNADKAMKEIQHEALLRGETVTNRWDRSVSELHAPVHGVLHKSAQALSKDGGAWCSGDIGKQSSTFCAYDFFLCDDLDDDILAVFYDADGRKTEARITTQTFQA